MTGYAYDPDLVELARAVPRSDMGDVVRSRAEIDALYATVADQLDTTGVSIEDRRIPAVATLGSTATDDGIGVRVYRPDRRGAGSDDADPPPRRAGVLSIHGGGFVTGNLDSDVGLAVHLVNRLGVVVVSVDYRLAPEHPFPAGLDDCYAALVWTDAHADELGVDPARLAVFGNSAGGGLAAATALLARDQGGPGLCFQFLGIPELDDRLDTPSMLAFDDTPMWHRTNAELSWRYYLGDDPGPVSPYAAPARAEDLSGLPRTYLSTMEFDPLRDEGLRYGQRLLEAGVAVELHQFAGTFHGSLLAPKAWSSQRQMREMIDVLAHGLGTTQVQPC